LDSHIRLNSFLFTCFDFYRQILTGMYDFVLALICLIFTSLESFRRAISSGAFKTYFWVLWFKKKNHTKLVAFILICCARRKCELIVPLIFRLSIIWEFIANDGWLIKNNFELKICLSFNISLYWLLLRLFDEFKFKLL
jgi:hypothetical protein